MNEQQDLVIFTDGASRGNPGPGGWGAVLVYPKLEEVVELGGAQPKTTNNAMELSAVIAALGYAAVSVAPTHIYTDSSYVIGGATKWIGGWKQNGWQTKDKQPVKNKELWQQLDVLLSARQEQTTVTWHHLPGHVGVPGNERADAIATLSADGKPAELFRGKMDQYSIGGILTVPDEAGLAALQADKKSNAGKAHSYLVVIDGQLERYEKWDDTKARVSGQAATYRKALSPEHEAEVIAGWQADGTLPR